MAKDEVVTIEAQAVDGWDVVISFAKLGERRAFVKALQKAGEDNDEEPLFPWMAKFVKQWPYEANPANVSCYDELAIEQWDTALEKVLKALERFRSASVREG